MTNCSSDCPTITKWTTRKQDEDGNFFIQNPLLALELVIPLVLVIVVLIVIGLIVIICKKTKKVRETEENGNTDSIFYSILFSQIQ